MVIKKTSSVLLSEGESTTVTALRGTTSISVKTTGKTIIQPQTSTWKREPYILLSDCEYGRLLLSPKGLRMSLHLNMPIGMASEEEFVHYTRMLYRMYLESAC